MPAKATAPTFEGIARVDNCMKMSYFNGGETRYGESYRFEISSPEREAAIAEVGDDPMADMPPALIVSASFDTSDGGPTILMQDKKYTITLTEIPE